MDFLPIFIDLRHSTCVVVGGGELAARKIAVLLRAGARVVVVAPALCAELAGRLSDSAPERLIHRAEAFRPEHLEDASLAIAATGDAAVDQAVSEAARRLHVPVNVVDHPALCSFIMPAIVDRSPVLIAVSSSGSSPVLSRLLRARIETLIPAAYGRMAAYAAEFRERVKTRFSHPENRRIFWEKMLQGTFADHVLAGRDGAARRHLEHALANEADTPPQGEVYLVGAGPGDPELLTLRALRLMQQADVVVHDRLVSQEILDLTRRDAPRIYAGKERNRHVMPQGSINQLLVRLAQEGRRVLRLKGGDPFIFGRGGEEIETLIDHGIPFQVVPGITAASGAAAYAGIPLTHRDHAQSCIFVTGHLKDGSVDLDWPLLTQANQTLVIYMGLVGLPVLCAQLITHGLNAATPAAIIQQASTRKQRVLAGTLATLPKLAAAAHLVPPTLIIVGGVVSLHRRLAWFNPGPDAAVDPGEG